VGGKSNSSSPIVMVVSRQDMLTYHVEKNSPTSAIQYQYSMSPRTSKGKERDETRQNRTGQDKSKMRTRTIEPHATALEFLLIGPSPFFPFFPPKPGLRGSAFAMRSYPYPREGISDVPARGSIIRVPTVDIRGWKGTFTRIIG